ncbi:MAG: outer membrane protein assembly factor BamA, partial [Parachlamydiales bacterium]
MAKWKFLSFIFFLFCAFSLPAKSDSEPKVEKIEIIVESNDPNYKIDTETLLSRLKTQKGSRFSQKTFDGDLKKLAEEFESVASSTNLEEGKLSITITLQTAPLIESLRWEGNRSFSSSKLQKELDLKEKTKFSSEKFQKGLTKVKELYLKNGFFESEITYKLVPVEKKNAIAIELFIKEGKSGHIGQITIQGLTRKEEKEVLKTFYTKDYNLLTSWLTGWGIYKQEALDQDQLSILSYLNNLGYADARVEVKTSDNPQTGKLKIALTVTKGRVYHFGKITLSGNKIFKNEEIQPLIKIKEGEIYSPEKIRESAKAIKDFYGAKGYIESEAVSETSLKEKAPVYDVHFEIEENEQFKIGLIHIRGNTQTKTNVILREALLTPGNVFDSRRIEATQKRLENMGYFKNVNVYAVKSADPVLEAENFRDVFIEVEETQTGSVNFSVGFSALNDIFGSLELTERNFNYRGLATMFTKGPQMLRGAGEYLHANATFGKKQRSYLLTWMDPYFRETNWRFGFELSDTWSQLQTRDYTVKTYGGSLFTSYPLSNFWTYGSKYKMRHSATDIKKHHGELPPQEEQVEDNHGLISALSSSLTYDSTDNAFRARRGLRSFLELEYTGVWGDFYFLKMSWLNTYYIPIKQKGTFK